MDVSMIHLKMGDGEYAIAARGKLYRIQACSPLVVQVLLRLSGLNEQAVLIGISGQLPTATEAVDQAILDSGVVVRVDQSFEKSSLWRWLDQQAPLLAAASRTMRPVGPELNSAKEFEAYCREDEFYGKIARLGYAMHLKANRGRPGLEPSQN